MTTATEKKLSAEQARKLHDADVAVKKLRASLKAAEKHSTELRDRYHDRVPISADPKEAADGIRVVEVGGVSVRVTPTTGGDRFSLTVYKEAGHEITPAMTEAIATGKPYDRWTVSRMAGPTKLGAVEPT